MRLIYAENLIKDIEGATWYHINPKGQLVGGAESEEKALYKAEDIYRLINSAPTIEVNQFVFRAKDDAELELLREAWGKGEVCFTPIVVYKARPTGAWIKISSPLSEDIVVKCPFCNDEFIGNDVEHYNFCPECGADLRGEGI